jgi:hypothetical protein
MTTKTWDPHDEPDRAQFAALLAPLAYAARCHDFDAPRTPVESREVQMRLTTWMRPFAEVPRDITTEAFTRVLERGVGWMPRADEVKAVCCDIVDERRTAAAKYAQRQQDECLVCRDQRGWMPVVVNGVETVDRCGCWRRGRQAIEAAGEPLTRPALPAHEEPAPTT